MIETYIAMYAPLVVTAISMFTQFCVTLKSLKGLAREKIFTEIKDDMAILKAQNRELMEKNKRLMEELTRVVQNEVGKNEEL